VIPAIFEHLEGKETCSTLEEVRAVLERKVDGGNAFNIYKEQDALFPYFSVLTRGEYAYIWYAPDESSAGIQAWGEDLGLDPEGSVNFYIPELTVTPNDYILSKETALQVVLAFMELEEWPACYEEMPSCVEWEEL
jgi:hypothetical protein